MMKTSRLSMFFSFGLIAALAATACVIEEKNESDKSGDAGGSGGSGGDGGSTDPGDDAGPDGSDGGSIPLPNDFSETCDAKGDNTSRDKALGFGKNVQVCIDQGHESWFKVTAPDEGGGAYLLAFTYEQEGAGMSVKAFAGADNSKFLDQWTEAGTSGHFSLTVGAGATTYLQFERYLAGPGLAKLSLEITQENDAYEPNNSRDDAAEVNLNEDIHGQLWVPYVSDSDKNGDDWFKVDLDEGDATLKLTKVPENLSLRFEVQGPTFVEISNGWNANPGALYEAKLTVKQAGTHYFRVYDFVSQDPGPAYWNKKPKSLSEQYTLRIEQ